MAPDLIELEPLDMLDFVDHLDERGSDNTLRKPRRQKPRSGYHHSQTKEQLANRRLHRPEKLCFRNHRRQRPAGKGKRRQCYFIGFAIPDRPDPMRQSLAHIITPRRLFCSALCDRQQRLIGSLRVYLVSIPIRRRDNRAVPIENEGGSRLSDSELRQKLRQPRILNNDAENALTFLIDVDRARERDRGPLADRMGRDIEPLGIFGLHTAPKPFLIGDRIGGVFKAAVFELDIARYHFVLVDTAPKSAVHLVDFHHFKAGVTELVGGEKRAVGPAERDPRDTRLGLQLRQEYEFALVSLTGLEDILQKQRAYRGVRGPGFRRNR